MDGGKVVRLLKTLYGLKQAPREWNKVLNSFMVGQRMTQHKCDPAVYSRGQGDNQLIVAVYVDDTTIMSKSISEVLSMKSALSGRFMMTDIGEVGTILGIKVIRDRESQTLSLSQEKYVADILTKFNMQNCAGKRTPMIMGLKLTKDMCPSTDEEVTDMINVPYKEAVGSLMYVMTCTRPDIATAVSCVSAFMHNPGREHWNAVKRIFQYLKYTMNYGLKYTSQDKWEVTGYCDSDWGGDIDSLKSTTGYVFIAGGAAISWCSKKQNVVARSSTEAEHVASIQAGVEAKWLVDFNSELGINIGPVLVYTDNQANLKVMSKQEARGRTRHFAIQKAFLRELIEQEIVTYDWIRSEEQVADILTKALTEEKVVFCRENVGVVIM